MSSPRPVLAGLLAVCLVSPAWAQDVGSPAKEQLEQALPKPAVFTLCGSRLSDPAVLRRHASAHLVFHGCRRVRRPAHAPRCLPLRQGRAGDLLHRPAGEALPSARLPRGRRSLRQHGLLSGSVRGQARDPRRPDRPQVVRHDPVRQGRGGRDRDHRRLLARDVPEGPHVFSGHARLSQRVAGDDCRRGAFQRAGPLHRLHRLRVDLEHRRQQPASQCHLPRQRRQGEPGRAVHRLSAVRQRQSGRAVEMDGGLRKEDRRQRAGHRAQRQSEQWHRCSPSSRPSASGSTANMPSSARNGSGSTRPRRPRAPARRIRSCRRTTSSPPSRSGTRATSTAALQRSGRCSNSSTPARRYKNGLKLERQLGTNPYKFGLIGSSDAHTGLAAMEEDNFFGKTDAAGAEPAPHDRCLHRQCARPA